jgi:hypothetical protein
MLISLLEVVERNSIENQHVRHFSTPRILEPVEPKRPPEDNRSKKRATRLAVERMQAFERGEAGLRCATWEAAKKEFLKNKASVCRSSTPDAYGWSLAAFERIVKPRNLTRVDVRMLQRFAAGRSDEGWAAATVNKDLRAVCAFLRWAVEQRYTWTVPAFKTAWVRADAKQPVVIPLAEYQAWLTALDSGKLRLTKRPAAWWKVSLRQACMNCFWASGIVGCQRTELWRTADGYSKHPSPSCRSGTPPATAGTLASNSHPTRQRVRPMGDYSKSPRVELLRRFRPHSHLCACSNMCSGSHAMVFDCRRPE